MRATCLKTVATSAAVVVWMMGCLLVLARRWHAWEISAWLMVSSTQTVSQNDHRHLYSYILHQYAFWFCSNSNYGVCVSGNLFSFFTKIFQHVKRFNSFAPGRFGCGIIDTWFSNYFLWFLAEPPPMKLPSDECRCTLVMTWCRQATRHDLSQYWPRFISSKDVTGRWWVNIYWLYFPGETYTAEDGCNTCSCSALPGGHLVPACTVRVCPEEPENHCIANGVTYQAGKIMILSISMDVWLIWVLYPITATSHVVSNQNK